MCVRESIELYYSPANETYNEVIGGSNKDESYRDSFCDHGRCQSCRRFGSRSIYTIYEVQIKSMEIESNRIVDITGSNSLCTPKHLSGNM